MSVCTNEMPHMCTFTFYSENRAFLSSQEVKVLGLHLRLSFCFPVQNVFTQMGGKKKEKKFNSYLILVLLHVFVPNMLVDSS